MKSIIIKRLGKIEVVVNDSLINIKENGIMNPTNFTTIFSRDGVEIYRRNHNKKITANAMIEKAIEIDKSWKRFSRQKFAKYLDAC